jgi:protein involved in temperature-dependent protein secretion
MNRNIVFGEDMTEAGRKQLQANARANPGPQFSRERIIQLYAVLGDGMTEAGRKQMQANARANLAAAAAVRPEARDEGSEAASGPNGPE